MADYVYCVRKKSGDGFKSEPGANHWLKVPGNVKSPKPSHGIAKRSWIEEVMTEARHGPQDDGPVGDIVIYVHGFNTPQSEMLRRTDKIEQGVKAHGFRGAVVAYDWPSDGSAINYQSDRRDAKKTAAALVRDGIAPLMAV